MLERIQKNVGQRKCQDRGQKTCQLMYSILYINVIRYARFYVRQNARIYATTRVRTHARIMFGKLIESVKPDVRMHVRTYVRTKARTCSEYTSEKNQNLRQGKCQNM